MPVTGKDDYVEYVTKEEYEAMVKGKGKNKYNAKKVTIDGIKFDSLVEGRRYRYLKVLEQAGEIRDLVIHPSWSITVNGERIGKYTADFQYWDYRTSREIVEDVKGRRTRDYVIRVKLMKAVHNISIVEVKDGDF